MAKIIKITYRICFKQRLGTQKLSVNGKEYRNDTYNDKIDFLNLEFLLKNVLNSACVQPYRKIVNKETIKMRT